MTNRNIFRCIVLTLLPISTVFATSLRAQQLTWGKNPDQP